MGHDLKQFKSIEGKIFNNNELNISILFHTRIFGVRTSICVTELYFDDRPEEKHQHRLQQYKEGGRHPPGRPQSVSPRVLRQSGEDGCPSQCS